MPRPTMTHHHPPTSTTTHHQPKYIQNHPTTHHHSQSSTTTRYQPEYIPHHPPLPITSQNISTTTHNQPKNGPPPSKSQNMFIYSITSFWHCFNSFFFYEMQCSFPWWRFCVKKFWSVCFTSSKFLLHFTMFIFFKFIFQEFKFTRFT